jgi:diadenosine tetraphosphate (Ap4A) HIT family hydrolase
MCGGLPLPSGVPGDRLEWLGAEWALAPSLGPVSPVHILLLPREHRACALTCTGALTLVEKLGRALRTAIAPQHDALLFEHANSTTGCGILHAHVHLVAVPSGFDATDVFGSMSAKRIESLAALLGEERELSWSSDTRGGLFAAVDVRLPSQTGRRAVAAANSARFDTDWKTYTHSPWFEGSRRVSQQLAATLRRSMSPTTTAA